MRIVGEKHFMILLHYSQMASNHGLVSIRCHKNMLTTLGVVWIAEWYIGDEGSDNFEVLCNFLYDFEHDSDTKFKNDHWETNSLDWILKGTDRIHKLAFFGLFGRKCGRIDGLKASKRN